MNTAKRIRQMTMPRENTVNSSRKDMQVNVDRDSSKWQAIRFTTSPWANWLARC